jgi:hypothetical protein
MFRGLLESLGGGGAQGRGFGRLGRGLGRQLVACAAEGHA